MKTSHWDVEELGLFDAPQLRVLATDQKHGSVDRAIRVLGFGRAAIRTLETTATGAVEPATLKEALAEEQRPVIVILNAADLNAGTCDPFSELIPIAHRAGACGCTEIPLIITETNSVLPTLDSTRILARAALRYPTA